MRKLRKQSKPHILEEHAAEMNRKYTAAGAEERRRLAPWRHQDIKEAVAAETLGRCCYCDGEILATSFGDIEHILPKSKFPHLVCEWTNLSFACQRCNNAKGDYYSTTEPLINPFECDPRDHLAFLGDLVLPLDGSAMGYVSILKLRLSRKELVESRRTRIDAIAIQLSNIDLAKDTLIKDALRKILLEDFAEGAFRNSVRSILLGTGHFLESELEDALTAVDRKGAAGEAEIAS